MRAVTIEELSQIRKLLNSIPNQKASVILSFPSILKNGQTWTLKLEIYHAFTDSKNHF